MRKLIIYLVPLVVALASTAFAQTAAEVAVLAQKGVGEDVLLAFVEASDSSIQLSADDIVKLKDAKVSDKVIVAMLRHHPVARQAAEPQPGFTIKRARRPVPAEESQEPVEGQPAPEQVVVDRQPVVEAPATTYVYNDYPYSYYSGYDYPYYYSGYYPYCYPYFGFGYGYYGHHHYGHNYSNYNGSHYSNYNGSNYSNYNGSHYSNNATSPYSGHSPSPYPSHSSSNYSNSSTGSSTGQSITSSASHSAFSGGGGGHSGGGGGGHR
ncbi:MAG: hypothetical protein ABSE73_20230 [Planctomycetota bacterium]